MQAHTSSRRSTPRGHAEPRADKPGFFMTNRVANRVLIPLLRSPAGRLLGSRLAVVEYVGRRTGQHHELVTGYSEGPGNVSISVGAAGRKTWWRNFATPHPIRIRLAGQDYEGQAQLALLARHDGQVSILVTHVATVEAAAR